MSSTIILPKMIKLTDYYSGRTIMFNADKIVYFEFIYNYTEVFCVGMKEPVLVKELEESIKEKLCTTFNFS